MAVIFGLWVVVFWLAYLSFSDCWLFGCCFWLMGRGLLAISYKAITREAAAVGKGAEKMSTLPPPCRLLGERRGPRRKPKDFPKGPPTTAQTLSRNLVRFLLILGHILAPKMTLKMSPKSSRNIYKLWQSFSIIFYNFFRRDRFRHLGKSLKSIVNTNRIARWHFCAYVVSV